MNYEKIEDQLSIVFTNKKLLKQAFTHSSYVNEHRIKNIKDNERLEFLGDAVLELLVSEFLFKEHAGMSEGELTKLRATIVCEESLFHFAETLKFNQYILLGKGEERAGGRNRQALLADVFEAFLGALYLDQGVDSCQDFLNTYVLPNTTSDAFSHMMDYKTKLQELVQQKKGNSIQYQIIEERGPSHKKEFIAEVVVNKNQTAVGIGTAKKDAEQHAAKKMLDILTDKK